MGLGQPRRVLWTEPLVICGFGEVGAALARFAVCSGRHPHRITVMEQDAARARLAVERGYRVVSSDATSRPALRSAGVGVAGRIIICLGDDHALAAVRAARSLAPSAAIQVVLHHSRHECAATEAGADVVLPLPKLAGKLLAAAALSTTS